MSIKKSKLELKRRTIANLNNSEMSHFYGGGGDDEGGSPTRASCDKETIKKINDIISEGNKVVLSKLLLICG